MNNNVFGVSDHQSCSALSQPVVIAPSGGLEFSTKGSIHGGMTADFNERFPLGGKYITDNIREIAGNLDYPDGCFRVYDGLTTYLVVANGSSRPKPAGGTINAMMVLRALGINQIGVVFPVGNGHRAKVLCESLENMAEVFLLPADRTDATLSLRKERQGTTVLCRKHTKLGFDGEEGLREDIIRALRSVKTQLLMLCSVKPLDWPIVEALSSSSMVKNRTFLPHMSLIKDASYREGMLKLMSISDIVQMNASEAAAFLGQKSFDYKEDCRLILNSTEFRKDAFIIVTMDKYGAVLIPGDPNQEPVYVPAIPVPVDEIVDTCGLGDALGATFARYYFGSGNRNGQTLSAVECLKIGTWVASEMIRYEGPWSGTPKHPLRSRAIGLIKDGVWGQDLVEVLKVPE